MNYPASKCRLSAIYLLHTEAGRGTVGGRLSVSKLVDMSLVSCNSDSALIWYPQKMSIALKIVSAGYRLPVSTFREVSDVLLVSSTHLCRRSF